MEKIDVLKLVRENQEKFKKHMEKMKELEERDKQLNYDHFYKNYDQVEKDSTHKLNQLNIKEKLTTIPELESTSVKKTLNDDSGNETRCRIQPNNKYINYYDSQEDNLSDYRSEEDNENAIENQSHTGPKNDNKNNSHNKHNEYDNDSYENNRQVREVNYDTNTEDSKQEDQDSKGKYRKETSEEKDLDYSSHNDLDNQDEYFNEKKLIRSTSSNTQNTYQSHPTPKFSNNYQNFHNYSKKLETENKKLNKLKIERQASAYTAFTYSTIKKIKSPEEEKKSKPKLFNKQYKGKIDRVALYQQRKEYWDKKPYLSNMPLGKTVGLIDESKLEVNVYNLGKNKTTKNEKSKKTFEILR